MNKVYYLQGLNCANCANKIEREIKELEAVEIAALSFASSTLRLNVKENHAGEIDDIVAKLVHKYEPDILISEQKQEEAVKPNKKLYRLIGGALMFALAIAVSHYLDLSLYMRAAVYLVCYLALGADVLIKALVNISKGQIFDENFLMSIATVGAFCIGDYPEAAAVMLFYQTGEYFQDAAVQKSRNSITKLMDIRPDQAFVKRGDSFIGVAPEEVAVGEIILVKPGERIPLDGEIISGSSTLDTVALTGESLPRSVTVGDGALSGCINQGGLLEIRVTKLFSQSTVARIIDLVENASSKKAPTENFITVFSRYYTPAVVGLALALAVLPPLLFGGEWAQWINRGLIFLVISCPCALVISIPLGFFGGIGGASRRGVLVKGGNYLEALNSLDIMVFDKTGTLTKGVFKLTGVECAEGFDKDELLSYAAHAEAFSNHPIALSIKKAYAKKLDDGAITNYTEISGYGISADVHSTRVLAGNESLMRKFCIEYEKNEALGTKVYVSVGGTFAGSLVITDEIKPDSKSTICALKSMGISKTVMLTGDNALIANDIAEELGIDEVYSELLPAEKVEKLEQISANKRKKGKLAFVGDGINDAPVLAGADIGIAMGAMGADAAIEAADIVLMTDEPSRLIDAIKCARFTKRIVWQNIAFSLIIKAIILILGALGMASMWAAVFADVGVAMIAILNAMRALKQRV